MFFFRREAEPHGGTDTSRTSICGGDNLPAAVVGIDLAGNESGNTVADDLTLNGGDLGNNSLVVVKIVVEACSVLFHEGSAHSLDIAWLNSHAIFLRCLYM